MSKKERLEKLEGQFQLLLKRASDHEHRFLQLESNLDLAETEIGKRLKKLEEWKDGFVKRAPSSQPPDTRTAQDIGDEKLFANGVIVVNDPDDQVYLNKDEALKWAWSAKQNGLTITTANCNECGTLMAESHRLGVGTAPPEEWCCMKCASKEKAQMRIYTCPSGNTGSTIKDIFATMLGIAIEHGKPTGYASDLVVDYEILQDSKKKINDTEVGTLFFWMLRDSGTHLFDCEFDAISRRKHYLIETPSQNIMLWRVERRVDGYVQFVPV